MPLEKHPTKPDTLVFRGHPAAMMLRARTVTEAMNDLAERIETRGEEIDPDAWARLMSLAPDLRCKSVQKRLATAWGYAPSPTECEMGPMCVNCNPKGADA